VLAAGIATVDRDPWHAVRHHDVGFTDMVKRASVAAAELSKDELRAGFERVTRVCEWLAPEVICFLGIGGWRDLVNRKATVGWQPERVGPSRVYVMPNPSGLNASTQHDGYVEHLRALTQG
jgi:TDG/mug DNA glycosylase family protein